jgi:hypothetical protein
VLYVCRNPLRGSGELLVILDNTTIETFTTCPAKYLLRIREGLAPKKVSSALNAGKVLHSGLEVWYKTGDLGQALQACKDKWDPTIVSDDFRNLEKILGTLVTYTKNYPTEKFKILGVDTGDTIVEDSFTLPTGMVLDMCPVCHFDHAKEHTAVREAYLSGKCFNCDLPLEPIQYGGIFDLLVDWAGTLYVLDHKTTTQFGQYYHTQWKPNNQITGYVWGAQELSGRKVGGAVINVIAWYKASPTKFDRHITTRDAHDIVEWKENVRQIANLIHRANLLGEYPLVTKSCIMYGKCEYHMLHESSNPQVREGLKSMYYEHRPWDHERRDEVTPA